jgi:hypothetical protein
MQLQEAAIDALVAAGKKLKRDDVAVRKQEKRPASKASKRA